MGMHEEVKSLKEKMFKLEKINCKLRHKIGALENKIYHLEQGNSYNYESVYGHINM